MNELIENYFNALVFNPTHLSEKEVTGKEIQPTRKMIADRCIEWVTEQLSNGNNPRKDIFKLENFDGDWSKVAPLDYFLHRLSIIGLPTNVSEITPEWVSNTIRNHTERLAARRDVLIAAYNDFNRYSKKLEMSVKFDPNRIYFLDYARRRELQPKPHSGFCMTSHLGEVVIPDDDEYLNQNPDALYCVIVHELGHQARAQQRLDDGEKKDKTTLNNFDSLFIEGMVQIHAQDICEANNRKPFTTYQCEVEVMKKLRDKLGIQSLMGMSITELKERIRTTYFLFASESGDLAEDFKDGFFDYMIASRKLEKIPWGEDLTNALDTMLQIHDFFFQKWQLV